MRWYFTFWNQTKDALKLAFTEATYMADNLGNSYKFLAGKSTNDITINPAIKLMDYWLDFDAFKVGATSYKVKLANYHNPQFPFLI